MQKKTCCSVCSAEQVRCRLLRKFLHENATNQTIKTRYCTRPYWTFCTVNRSACARLQLQPKLYRKTTHAAGWRQRVMPLYKLSLSFLSLLRHRFLRSTRRKLLFIFYQSFETVYSVQHRFPTARSL